MKMEDDAHTEALVQQKPQRAATGERSRRAFFGKAAVAGLGLATAAATASAESSESGIVEAKIRRALLAGPAGLTKDATVVDRDAAGNRKVLRQGTNKWICTPGDENKIGDPPLCADPVAMQWFADAKARKRKPTNTVPGMAYMLCGATQRSNTDPFDTTSPAIPHRSTLDDLVAVRSSSVRSANNASRQRSVDDVRRYALRLPAHLRHPLRRQGVSARQARRLDHVVPPVLMGSARRRRERE